jgi:hypothetical protein
MVEEACTRQEVDRSDYRFSRRDVRQYTGWGNTQLRLHLGRLAEMEYLLVHRGGRGQSFVYELLWKRSKDNSEPILPGLIDAEKLHGYDPNNAGPNGDSAGAKRGQNGEVAGSLREEESSLSTEGNGNSGLELEKLATEEANQNQVVTVEVPANGTGH